MKRRNPIYDKKGEEHFGARVVEKYAELGIPPRYSIDFVLRSIELHHIQDILPLPARLFEYRHVKSKREHGELIERMVGGAEASEALREGQRRRHEAHVTQEYHIHRFPESGAWDLERKRAA